MPQLSQFAYENVPVSTSELCVQNDLHFSLCNRGLQGNSPTLITFNNFPPVVGRVDASEIDLGGTPLDTWVGRAQLGFLRDNGVELPTASTNRLCAPLVISYLLKSSVCVAMVNAQSGTEFMLVTKSSEVVSALRSQLAPADRKKGIEHFNSQFTTSYEELRSGQYNTVRLISDVDGMRLGKLKISARSSRHLLPYYSVKNYAAQLLSLFSKHKVFLTYQNADGMQAQIVTTLIPHVVAEWLGITSNDVEHMKLESWRNPATLGYFDLPILSPQQRGEFASVPILNILSIQPAKHS